MTTPLDKAVEAMAERLVELDAVYAEARAKEQLQAADDLLREHYWGELRERLLGEEGFEVAIAAICKPGPTGGMIGRAQSVLDALAALATTQKEEL